MASSAPLSPPTGDVLLAEDRDGVRLLTLNRPQALNAFDARLLEAMTVALADAAGDDGVRIVALTGAGRAFTAGSDIADDGKDPGAEDPWDAFIETVESFPKPLVAAVNGLAVGLGTTILGHCDLALAGESARFKMPFASLGLVPEAGSTSTLPALMGRHSAIHALLTGSWIPAQQALASGLVWRVTADSDLMDETRSLCGEIAAHPLESLLATKALLLAARLPGARAAREREEPEFRRLLGGPAHAAALAAFEARKA
jgi:enoyl-CoA hydratase/carnithine racemase